MILSSNNDNSSDSSSTDKVSLLTDEDRDPLVLRRRTIIKESPPNSNGDDDNKYSASALLLHTKLGDITIHFTPEYSGMSTIVTIPQRVFIDIFYEYIGIAMLLATSWPKNMTRLSSYIGGYFGRIISQLTVLVW
jgi:hypothetical protein